MRERTEDCPLSQTGKETQFSWLSWTSQATAHQSRPGIQVGWLRCPAQPSPSPPMPSTQLRAQGMVPSWTSRQGCGEHCPGSTHYPVGLTQPSSREATGPSCSCPLASLFSPCLFLMEPPYGSSSYRTPSRLPRVFSLRAFWHSEKGFLKIWRTNNTTPLFVQPLWYTKMCGVGLRLWGPETWPQISALPRIWAP